MNNLSIKSVHVFSFLGCLTLARITTSLHCTGRIRQYIYIVYIFTNILERTKYLADYLFIDLKLKSDSLLPVK